MDVIVREKRIAIWPCFPIPYLYVIPGLVRSWELLVVVSSN